MILAGVPVLSEKPSLLQVVGHVTNNSPISVREFVDGIGKFRTLSEQDKDDLQALADERYETICKLAGELR